jgi:hypothetical protein
MTPVGSPREVTGKLPDPQMVCLVLDGPPANSVELPPAPAQPGERKSGSVEVHQSQRPFTTRKSMSQ